MHNEVVEIKRPAHVNIIVGRRGCGKSTFEKEMLIKPYPRKVLIVDLAGNDLYNEYQIITPAMFKAWKSGTKRIIGIAAEDAFEDIKNDLTNAMVVFEDATAYVNVTVPDVIRRLIVESKQRSLDLIFVFHSFADTPRFFFRLANSITIFKTDEDISQYKKKISNYTAVEKAWKEVMKNPDKYYYKSVRIN